jgi:hypothetical protein
VRKQEIGDVKGMEDGERVGEASKGREDVRCEEKEIRRAEKTKK